MTLPLRRKEMPPAVVIPIRDQSIQVARRPSYQAFQILQAVFTIVPIITGLDKFLGLLVHWDKYLSPVLVRLLGSYFHTVVLAAGALEVLFGVGVAIKPKIFGYILFVWFLMIVANLMMNTGLWDIALRDFALALGALAMTRLSVVYQR
jgi:hypothetical protein